MASVTKTAGLINSSTGWTGANVTNLMTIDTNRATTNSSTYRNLDISYFDFGIPSGATVNGIEITFSMSSSNASATAYIQASISKNNGSSFTSPSAEQSHAGTTNTSKTVGGSTDLWGLTLLDSEVNDNNNFIVRIAGKISNTSYTCRVTYVSCTVYFTEAAISAIKSVNGLAKASVKSVNGLAIASVKSWNGLA